MKKIVVFSLLLSILSSCAKEIEEQDPESYPQKWKLIKMNGNRAGTETIGDAMDWQESYILNSDKTFVKRREQNGVQTEASGIFSIINSDEGKFVELIYANTSNIIASCYGTDTEKLFWESNLKMIGTWSHCDGPGLEYERIE